MNWFIPIGPADPHEAVLEPGSQNQGIWLRLVAGSVFSLLPLGLILMGWFNFLRAWIRGATAKKVYP
jgi:hypothetical protein